MQGKYPSVGRSPVGNKCFSKLPTGLFFVRYKHNSPLPHTHKTFMIWHVYIKGRTLKKNSTMRRDLLTQSAIGQVGFLWQEERSSGPKTRGHMDKA